MPNIRSMKKDLRRNSKRRVQNLEIRSALKTYIKKARTADSSNARELALEACSKIDKAVAKGVIHKNQAARRKSRLMKSVRS